MSLLVCGCGFVETAERLRTSFTVMVSVSSNFRFSPLCLVLVLVSATHRKYLIGELGKAACGVWLDFFFLALEGAGLVLCRRIKIYDFLFLEARFSGVLGEVVVAGGGLAFFSICICLRSLMD
ncbi:unnamed protein product [Arabidopsis halleri]